MKLWVNSVCDRLSLAKVTKRKPRGQQSGYEAGPYYCGFKADRDEIEIDAGPKDPLFLVVADYPEKLTLNAKSAKCEFVDWVVTADPDSFVSSDDCPLVVHPIVFNQLMEV